jgi:hypothetical protein
VQQGGLSGLAGIGLLLPVHDRQLLEELQPVSRFVPRPAAFEYRDVVISAQRSAALDPNRPQTGPKPALSRCSIAG